MKKTVVRVVAIDLIFLLLLIVAGAFSGALSEIVYIGAYLVPLCAFLWLRGDSPQMKLGLSIDGADAAMCLPLIAPTIGVMLGLSALTSLALALCGVSGTQPLTGSIFELLILHALLPAILEEALFRYVPIALIAPHSRKSAVLISALLFSVAHCNIAQMPYAFVAGIVFAIVDIACASILPSVALHLLNNVVSVIWIWDASAPIYRLPLLIAVATLGIASIALVVIFGSRYAKKVSFIADKDDKTSIVPQVWVFVAVCLLLAVGSLV